LKGDVELKEKSSVLPLRFCTIPNAEAVTTPVKSDRTRQGALWASFAVSQKERTSIRCLGASAVTGVSGTSDAYSTDEERALEVFDILATNCQFATGYVSFITSMNLR
jgi:hypothetical protein